MNILFERTGKANLPEINAYIKYFNQFNNLQAHDTDNQKFETNDYDIIWKFMGTDFRNKKIKGPKVIHEYASLSTGLVPHLKDQTKKKFNVIPDLRIFLNQHVKENLSFKDSVPYVYRDMGVDKIFFQTKNKKIYDFVYVGDVNKERLSHVFLEQFKLNPKWTIALVGKYDQRLYQSYSKHKNIRFFGKVNYSNVAEIASQAVYGLNYMPNRYPYNMQTSTKALEYAALNLKIVSTDYPWIREFEKSNNLSIYTMKDGKLDFNNLKEFNFNSSIKEEDFLWDNIFRKSNIIDTIQKL